MRILIVEDEENAARMLAKGLRERAYAVDVAIDGEAAVYQATVNDYDVIILDVMLPSKDGLRVCSEIRESGSAVPILMLTARDSIADRVAGLDSGADDYLIKPFDLHELLARVRALLRRGPALRSDTFTIADLTVDIRSRSARRGDRMIGLTAKEYALLEFLVMRAGEVVTRAEIAEHVWDEKFDPFSNLIEVYIQRLRRKLDDGSTEKLIHTMRGEGYQLTPASSLAT